MVNVMGIPSRAEAVAPIIGQGAASRADMALTVYVADWSGRDYAEVSGLQRTMISESMAVLSFSPNEQVLDIGCGDGFLTRKIAELVPRGGAFGADASRRMIATAHGAHQAGVSGPWFVVADARRLPFSAAFDAVVSFNALHWVPQQDEALAQLAAVLKPGGRATLQMVCAGQRASLESTAMKVCQTPSWATWFEDFPAPFVHVVPDDFVAMARSAGLATADVSVVEREWDFGTREAFERWCAVGSTAWTDRLPEAERSRFVTAEVDAYEPVAGRPGLFRFTQMRADLRR
jgi:trans-aconitate 2-methyltransferase